MKGKRISYQKNLDDALLLAMLQSVNISEDDYTHVPLDFSAQNFIDNEVDVISVYLSDQPYYIKRKGVEFNTINPITYGFDFYGDNLFTTDHEIINYPDRVKRFREASLKGWKYALDHIDETIALIKNRYHAKSSMDHLHYEARVTKQLIIPDMVDIGYSDPNRFYRISKVYEQTGKASRQSLEKALEEIIYDPYQTKNRWIYVVYFIAFFLIVALIALLVLTLLNRRLNELVIKKTQEQNNLLSLFEHGDSVLFRWRNDKVWSIEYVSSNVVNLLGYTKEDFLSQDIVYANCIHQEDLDFVIKEVMQALKEQKEFFRHEPYRIITQSGEMKWVLDNTVLTRDSQGKVSHFLGYLIDITDHQNIRKNLEKFIERQNNIVFLTDGHSITFANRKFFEFLAYKDLESFKREHNCICDLFVSNERFFHLGKVKDNENWVDTLEQLEDSQKIVSLVGEDLTIHAFSVAINQFDERLKIITLTDISQTMLEHIQLEKKTIQDKLTGAFNREYFEQNYKRVIAEYTQKSYSLGVAILDIDHFKLVNDNYGHDVGDEILIAFVELINQNSREEDILIRWGGEEFILLLKVTSQEAMSKALENIRTVVARKRFAQVGHITCSIGATLYQNEEIKTTIKRADEALYSAKDRGRDQIVVA